MMTHTKLLIFSSLFIFAPAVRTLQKVNVEESYQDTFALGEDDA